MIRINENYTKLKASYLFSDIAKRSRGAVDVDVVDCRWIDFCIF